MCVIGASEAMVSAARLESLSAYSTLSLSSSERVSSVSFSMPPMSDSLLRISPALISKV